jgi:hypothetical protein
MEKKLNNTNIVKNIDTNQHKILYNIMMLHNNGNPFECDITASTLKFYNNGGEYNIPEPEILMDVIPQREDIIKIEEYKPLPLEDNSISSIVIDLPFVISPKDCPSLQKENPGKKDNLIFRRFHSFYPVSDLFIQYKHWIDEAYRVLKPDGICVFKCQDTVSGGINYFTESYSFLCASNAGFYIKDKFILQAKNRLIASTKIKKQQHARKYTSCFWVFKKDEKMANKTKYLDILQGNFYKPKK